MSVLLVDDEPGLRELIAEVLSDEGILVHSAADGASALQMLQQQGPVDLLISDMGLPRGISGRQLAEAARVVQPALPVVFITGDHDMSVPEPSGAPHTEVMLKPFALMELLERAKQIMAGAA